MAKKYKSKLENHDVDEEDEPDFSDPEGYVDSVDDEELLPDILRQQPKETDGVESVVIVDGLPQVEQDRQEKLKKVLRKIFSDSGPIITEYYPTDDNGKTKGYAFFEYKDRNAAEDAIRKRNNYKLDKQHTFLVNLLTDFNKYHNIPKDFVTPKQQPFKDIGNCHAFLMDNNCYDQYSVIYDPGTPGGSNTTIYLNSVPEPTEVQKRQKWTETYVRWSPRGTYLATFHGKGVALWGGEEFKQIQKFSHTGVQMIDFSPCENYLITFSPHTDQRSEEPNSVIIWSIRTGQKKRGFHAEKPQIWPVFKWSHDDKYFARITDDGLGVYETPSFGLMGKKSIPVNGIKDFSWSPTDNIVAYWIPENKDVPAKVALIHIPSRAEVRPNTCLFSVADCVMYWQKCGDHLCVKMTRYRKAAKEKNEVRYIGLYFNFEIFHMRVKEIPVDSLEITEQIQAFAWEPVDNKFAIICGEPPSISVTFYEVSKGQPLTELKKFEKRLWNNIFWSPQGQFVVLAGLRNMSGALDFVDTKDFQIMATNEHFMATDLEWDPTGRYITTTVSWWGHKVDNAYWMWSFQGKLLRKHSIDRFCQLLWRPRPPSIATAKEDIKKYVRKYASQFEIQDKMRLSKASKEIIEKRQNQMLMFTEYRKRMQDKFASEKQSRLELRSGQDTDTLTSNVNDIEEIISELSIKTDTTVID